jgi:hypothetical protein
VTINLAEDLPANPAYDSPDSPRRLLDEAEARTVEKHGPLRYAIVLIHQIHPIDLYNESDLTLAQWNAVITATAEQRCKAIRRVWESGDRVYEPIAIWDSTTWYENPRWALLTLSGAHDGEPIAVAVRAPYIGSDGDEDGNSFPVVEWEGSIKLADRITDLSDDLCDAYTDAICNALMAMAGD